MRSLGSTDCGPGRGRGALWALLLSASGLLALLLVAVLSCLAEPAAGLVQRERAGGEGARLVQGEAALFGDTGLEPPLTQARATEQDTLALGTGDVSALQLHRPLSAARGRAGFSPDAHAIQRAVRARQDAVIAAFGQRLRCSAVPAADGYLADRPTIVTRPLRGPPSHG